MFTDRAPLSYQVGKVGVTLREESLNKHLLRSRLFGTWEGSMNIMIEPLQAVSAQFPSIFKSAMLVGDVVRLHEHILQCLSSCLHDILT